MHTILLVDDEPAITESLAFALRRSGLRAVSAASLAQANAQLSEAQPALIILDLMLPDGDGLDWLRSLRTRSALPVIILSSHDDEIDHIVALELGADDYVDKPFSPREVVARVRAVLRRTLPTEEGAAEAGPQSDLHLDEARRLAWARGQSLNLSRLEFDLLSFLIQGQGRVFSREQLLDRVWGQDSNVTDRTVDVHVKTLRKKISQLGLPAETIETVRGVGYRLAESAGCVYEGRADL